MDLATGNYLRAWHVIEALDAYQKPLVGTIFTGIPIGFSVYAIYYMSDSDSALAHGLTIGLITGLVLEFFDNLSFDPTFNKAKVLLSLRKVDVLSEHDVDVLKKLTPKIIWEKLGIYAVCAKSHFKSANQEGLDLIRRLIGCSETSKNFESVFEDCVRVFGKHTTIAQLKANINKNNVECLSNFALQNEMCDLLTACKAIT
jgi:hypothetical protein